MATIGHGYGSEWHLLRWLGYHRSRLDKSILEETGLEVSEWLDFGFQHRPAKETFPSLDSEITHLDFLPGDHPARKDWLETWPVRNGRLGNGPNWDGVAKLSNGGWLLVEAKAHLGELQSPASQASSESLAKIKALMDKAKHAYGVPPDVPWTKRYYQQANRLAVLWFLNDMHGEEAHLLNICFIGDRFPGDRANCPRNAASWREGKEKMMEALGLSGISSLEEKVHYLYLPITECK